MADLQTNTFFDKNGLKYVIVSHYGDLCHPIICMPFGLWDLPQTIDWKQLNIDDEVKRAITEYINREG